MEKFKDYIKKHHISEKFWYIFSPNTQFDNLSILNSNIDFKISDCYFVGDYEHFSIKELGTPDFSIYNPSLNRIWKGWKLN